MPSEIIYLLSLLYTSVCLQQPPQPPWVCFCFVGWGAGAGGGRRAGFRSLFAEPFVGVEKTSPKSVWAFLFPDFHDKAKKGNRRRTNPSAQEREGEAWEGARGGAVYHISSIYDGRGRGGAAQRQERWTPAASPRSAPCRRPRHPRASRAPVPPCLVNRASPW